MFAINDSNFGIIFYVLSNFQFDNCKVSRTIKKAFLCGGFLIFVSPLVFASKNVKGPSN